jgi:hypothetical protein
MELGGMRGEVMYEEFFQSGTSCWFGDFWSY